MGGDNVLISCYYHLKLQSVKIWQVKLTDFGLSRQWSHEYNDDDDNMKMQLTEYVVTRHYRAPEVMACSRSYGTQIDCWSVGCLLGEMYYKRALFRGSNHLHQLQLLFYFCGTPSDDDLDWITTKECKHWALQLPKHKRKNFQKEFCFYNYCNGDLEKLEQVSANDDRCGLLSDAAADLLDKLLVLDPSQRWNMSRALKHPFFKNVYKATDYRQCPQFDTSFEAEPILRTNFGVRHMIYEELVRIHRHCKSIK